MDGRGERAGHSLVPHPRWIADIARVLTHLGDPLVVTALTLVAAAVLWLRRDRGLAVYVVRVRFAAVLVSALGKAAFPRARPVLPDPLAHAHGYSFPSGHALGSAALWGSFALVGHAKSLSPPAAVALAVVLPVFVAATRVLLGVHYVTDVVGGLLLGWACAALVWRLTP